MNKQEVAIVVLLFLLLLGWGFFQSQHSRPAPLDRAPPAPDESPAGPAGPQDVQAPEPEPVVSAPRDEKETHEAAPMPEPEAEHRSEERLLTLSNRQVRATLSSWGGGLTSVQLNQYAATVQQDSGPVVLDFSGKPALSLSGVPGLGTGNDFTVAVGSNGTQAVVRAHTESGIFFERTVTLLPDYRLKVEDTFRKEGDGASALPSHGVAVGPMESVQSRARTRGYAYLGLHTLPSEGGEGIEDWAKKGLFGKSPLMKAFDEAGEASADAQGRWVSCRADRPVDWVAAKNKFFIQYLVPQGRVKDCVLFAGRDPGSDNPDDLASVAAELVYPERRLASGDTWTRRVSYYVGPKQYSLLKTLGNHQDEVMLRAWRGWGWFRHLCIALLWTLNKLHAVIPNYGVAIILLTVIARVVLWPITHKSTQSMKAMQKLQPMVAEIREKYKDKPQKMNQEIMALYKEHKVNPMAGCLPMLLQMPIFIALFQVLRSAVELRFADFLWIRDLSEPEGLFQGMIPVIGAINILPVLMTVTMIWQQRLTPTAGDPQQQKMMTVFMPVFMLFIMYNMPSALTLYWTTSQCLSIVQLMLQRRRTAQEEEGAQARAERKAKSRT